MLKCFQSIPFLIMIICPKCLQNYHPRVNFCSKCQLPLPKPGMETTAPEAAGGRIDTDDAQTVCDMDAQTLPMDAPTPAPVVQKQRDAPTIPTPQEGTKVSGGESLSAPVEKLISMGAQVQAASSSGSATLSRLDAVPIERQALGLMDAAKEELQEEVEPITIGLRQFVELNLNVNRVLVEDTATVLEVSMKALTQEPLLDVKFEINCARVLTYPIKKNFAQFEHGRPVKKLCEFEFSENSRGTRLFNFQVSFTQLGRHRVFEGEVRLTILTKPDESKPNINLENFGNQVVAGDGGNAGLGAEHKADMDFSGLAALSKIKTINDLLEAKLPDNYFTVELSQISDEPTGARRICSAFLTTVEPAACLTLLPQGGGDEGLPLRLTAREEVAIGRQRDCCDLVTWFLPRSEERDQCTRSISKVHVVASAGKDGLYFRTRPDTNGAKLNSDELNEREPGARFENQGRLSLNAVPGEDYLIDLQHHGAAGSQAPEAENHQLWQGPQPELKPVTGCVVFRPVESSPAFRLCIWLLTEAAFGSGEDNPIYLPDSGLASSQGIFHHYRGCFWVENSADGADGDRRTGSSTGRVRVNGQGLRAGELAPLASGMTVELGNAIYQVELER